MELVELNLRLPLSLFNRMERLAESGGLTGEQLVQAIMVLDLHGHGWLKGEMADLPATTPDELSDPCLDTEDGKAACR